MRSSNILKYRYIVACAFYLSIIFTLAFCLSAVKNHYFVLGKDYVGAELVDIQSFFSEYIFEFWGKYNTNFLFALTPTLLVNFLFVHTIFGSSNVAKRMFNFFVATFGITWCLVCVLYHFCTVQIMFQILSFPVAMILIIIMECIVKIAWKTDLMNIFPYLMAIMVNMYYGICILSFAESRESSVSLLIYIVALYFIRFFFLAGQKKGSILFKILSVISCAVVFIGILILAWYDYTIHGPFERDWRQLYYVVVYSFFFSAYIMHYLPKVFNSVQEKSNGEQIRKYNLYIHATLLIIIPILSVFAVHGIILIILNAISLLVSYFFLLYAPFTKESEKSNKWLVVAYLFTVVTFFYMAADPIFYFNVKEKISAIWIFLIVALPILGFIIKQCIEAIKRGFLAYLLSLSRKIMSSSLEVKNQLAVIGCSLFILVSFIVMYYVREYADEVSGKFNAVEPPLEGFGGLYIWSWCVIPAFLNIATCSVSLIIMKIKKHGGASNVEKH